MTKKSTQQRSRPGKKLATDDLPLSAVMVGEERSPTSPSRFVLTVANILCLLVAGMYIWTTHDLVGFILLYGLATGAIHARDVVGSMLPHHLNLNKERDEQR
jgi:hypothetical protein